MNINGMKVEVIHDYLEFARRVLADAIDSTSAPSEDSAADASLIDLLRAANSYWDVDPEVVADLISSKVEGSRPITTLEINAHAIAYGIGHTYNDENDLPTLMLAAAHKILESAR